MKRVVLKNKPLVEAIFELRWKLKEIAPLRHVDPQYKILIGRIYDRISKEYPYHEQLPSAFMPDEMAHYMVQHRFRKDKDDWPLIQLGPGIITLNDTDSYVWEDFEKRIIKIIDTLFQTYPNSEKELDINSILLRYIDAVEFEYNKDDIFKFLNNQMKIVIDFNEKLFKDTKVNYLPHDFNFKYSFNSDNPKGIIHLSFARGKKKGTDALVWETNITTTSEYIPKRKDEIMSWVDEAHNLSDDWFFKTIEGKLYERFK